MRKRTRGGLAALVLVGALIVAPTNPALADGLPPTQYSPVTLTNMPSPSYTLSQPDGGVTLGCSGGSIATKRIDPTGTVVHDIPSTPSYPNTCARNAAVGADGMLFTVAMNSANSFTTIQAIKNGLIRWTYEFGCMVTVRGMVVGTNGNLYVLASGIWPCSGMNKLIGLAPEPVNGAPNVVLNTGMAAVLTDGGIASYTGGLVLRTTQGVQYVGYDGQFGAGTAITNMLGLGSAEYADATLSGRIVIPSQANCSGQMAGKLTAIDPTETAWEYELTTCSHIEAVRPTPSGGVVAHIVKQGVPHLLMVDANGQETALESVAAVPPGSELVSQAFKVDLHGNVAMQRWLMYDGQHKAIQLKTYSGISGIELSTYELGFDSVNGYGYHTFADLAIGRNTWYVPTFQCWYGSCQPAVTKLYAVTVPGLGMDYPRGAIISPAPQSLNYVALGDSFSSGEGVPGFEAGTDIAGPPENRCHRSLKSYPRLLSTTPGLNITLAFRACSGAATNQVVNVWPSDENDSKNTNEPPQVSAISTGTDVVTVTIGGNNIGFEDFVKSCVFNGPPFTPSGGCDTTGIYPTILGRIQYDLPAKLNEAMAEIKQRIGVGTKVYVIGYPMMIPHPSEYTGVGCMYLDTGEREAAREITTRLNAALVAAVASANNVEQVHRFVYVDPNMADSPFKGHELCSPENYFNGLNFTTGEFSFHPNNKGQDVFRQLLLRQLLLSS
ncbi:MAG TPA: SGNH/GDSL hydrolase family protein [Magnetospirillaceae bacterium]|nr:SGNH/GDSL hydrolase family protein [Magnetospirillaceae bacterium]